MPSSEIKDLIIYSPFPKQTGQGNTVTADRLEKILIENGHSVSRRDAEPELEDAHCLLALNARRSAKIVARFRYQFPNRKIIILITGTDINHTEMADADSPTRIAMKMAGALVLLHEGFLKIMPMSLAVKSQVIYPSICIAEGLSHQPAKDDCFHVLMVGNMRAEKAPLLAAEAAKHLPKKSQIKITSYGDASDDLSQNLQKTNDEIQNFHWAKKLDHASLLSEMSRADLLLNTSTQEGGANAICEAISIGLPVIASHIPGNVGMLGDDYEGFFPSGDAQALTKILSRCESDPSFYKKLNSQIAARAPLFSYAEESKRWIELVEKLIAS